jgi:hypothetical protein
VGQATAGGAMQIRGRTGGTARAGRGRRRPWWRCRCGGAANPHGAAVVSAVTDSEGGKNQRSSRPIPVHTRPPRPLPRHCGRHELGWCWLTLVMLRMGRKDQLSERLAVPRRGADERYRAPRGWRSIRAGSSEGADMRGNRSLSLAAGRSPLGPPPAYQVFSRGQNRAPSLVPRRIFTQLASLTPLFATL